MYVAINDDYAVLNTDKYYFYYGYEYERKETRDGESVEIWGFEVSDANNKKIFRISADQMEKKNDCPYRWDCAKMLLFGIGLFLKEENKKTQYCPYDNRCGNLYDCTREEYETMKQSNIKLSLKNSDLQEKLAIVNEMNVANYNKYCEELKRNKRLLEIAKKMHLYIFLNVSDEQSAYDEIGLTDEENAILGYSGEFVLKEVTNEDKRMVE